MKLSSLIFLLALNFSGYAQNNIDQADLVFPDNHDFQKDSVPAIHQNTIPSSPTNFVLKYNLEEPDQAFDLPEILIEISGLGFDKNYEKLYAVQDENGLIFVIDKISGEVEKKIEFHKDGDYEGVEVVGDVVYVVKNSGTVYEVKNIGQEDQTMEKYNLFLSKENDVEGLGFDPATKKLLLACKGVPATGESFEVIRYKKVVYGFDINTKEIDSLPVYNIQMDAIQQCLHTSTSIKNTEELMACFSLDKEDLDFNPSAIAIHPLTKDIYVLSSSGKTMIVLNYEGEIIYIEKMNKKVHRQPEGIAFDADGTLYISNEGKKETAKIYKFNYKQL